MASELTLKVVSTGASSAKYGDCEICKKPCAEVVSGTVCKRGTVLSDSFGHEGCIRDRFAVRQDQESARGLQN